MKNSFIMDADLAARFISTLTKSLQAVLHGCLDCEKDIELGGYVYLRIDNAQRVDYVLNEKMKKSNVNSMTFHSNSFHALPQPSSGNNAVERSSELDSSCSSERQPDGNSSSMNEHTNTRAFPRSNSTAASNINSLTRRQAEGLSQTGSSPSGSILPGSRSNDRTQHLGDNLQTAFQSPPHSSYSKLSSTQASGSTPAYSQNGSSSRHFSGSGPLQQHHASKSGILPDASEIEVVHIKTEDEDDVFSIPLACQQGGSGTDSKTDALQAVKDSAAISFLPHTMQPKFSQASGSTHLNWLDIDIPPIGIMHCDPSAEMLQAGVVVTSQSLAASYVSTPVHPASLSASSSSHHASSTRSSSGPYHLSHATSSQPGSSYPFHSESWSEAGKLSCSETFSRLYCEFCSHVSLSQRAHARHMTLKHAGKGAYACGECGKVFQTKLYLNQHMKSHGERKFVCEVCNQKFLYKHHVPRHQLAVHGTITFGSSLHSTDERGEDGNNDLSFLSDAQE